MRKYLPLALILGFFLLGINAFLHSQPTKKAPIYKVISKYSPYYLEKRFGGLEILNKDNKEFKQKPSNRDLFKQFEYLQKEWGKKHLKVQKDILLIIDKNKTIKIPLEGKQNRAFLRDFYGLQI